MAQNHYRPQLQYQNQDQQQVAPQLHQHIDIDVMQNEEIPLNRLNSREERAERCRIREIFNTVSSGQGSIL